jgi:hypothetical protein
MLMSMGTDPDLRFELQCIIVKPGCLEWVKGGCGLLLNGKIDDDADASEANDAPNKTWAIVVGICLLPIYGVFSLFGMQGKGTAAAVAMGTIILSVRMHLKYKTKVWFWIIIALALATNALLIVLVSFPNKNFTLPVVAPIGIADYLLIVLFISLMERVNAKRAKGGS